MNYNKIMLGGHLTRDPQLSYIPNQTAVVDFGLAINHRWKTKSDEQKEEVCFVDCVAFVRTAETLNKYLNKGMSLFVEDKLKFESWEAQDGTKRSKHKILVDNFQFLSDGQAQDQKPQSRETSDDDIPF